ncbi:MAG: FAD-binding protein, partial [Muribaculaceae bacterium]|nr:FAD-binding protein [Muribaculaceae bacterium]
MQHDLQLRIEPSVAADTVRLTKIAASSLSLKSERIKSVRIVRRSVDARQQRVMFNVTLRVWVDETPSESLLKPIDYKPVPQKAPQSVLVGEGPAGL